MTPQEIRTKWVEMLESGNYHQGKGFLHSGSGYCCLGVLCELAVKEGVAVEWEGQKNLTIYADADNQKDQSVSFLPDRVRQWAGLRTAVGGGDTHVGLDKPLWTLSGGGADRYALSSANDAGATFKQIAEIIKTRTEDLFES